jgi:hypothetical protein
MLKRRYVETSLWRNIVMLKRRYVETSLKRIVVNIFLRSSCIDALLQWLPIIFYDNRSKKAGPF